MVASFPLCRGIVVSFAVAEGCSAKLTGDGYRNDNEQIDIEESEGNVMSILQTDAIGVDLLEVTETRGEGV